MKKKMMLLAICMIVFLRANATEMNDTVIVVEQPQKVIIRETSQTMEVNVEGKKGNPDYRLQRMRALQDEITVVKESSNWNFSLPFQNINKDDGKRSDYRKVKCHLPDFAFGFSSALDGSKSLTTPLGSSVEFSFYPVEFTGPTIAKNLGFATGLGFAWRNYRMTGHTRFLKQDDQLVLSSYPDGADIEFSRIKTFSLVVPVLMEWQQLLNNRKHFWLNGGMLVNFNTYSSCKTRYKLEGREVKEFDKNIHEQPVTLDLYTSFGFNDVGLYLRYSPFHVLRGDYSPTFSSLSFGILIDL